MNKEMPYRKLEERMCEAIPGRSFEEIRREVKFIGEYKGVEGICICGKKLKNVCYYVHEEEKIMQVGTGCAKKLELSKKKEGYARYINMESNMLGYSHEEVMEHLRRAKEEYEEERRNEILRWRNIEKYMTELAEKCMKESIIRANEWIKELEQFEREGGIGGEKLTYKDRSLTIRNPDEFSKYRDEIRGHIRTAEKNEKLLQESGESGVGSVRKCKKSERMVIQHEERVKERIEEVKNNPEVKKMLERESITRRKEEDAATERRREANKRRRVMEEERMEKTRVKDERMREHNEFLKMITGGLSDSD